ncbi:hypothetical protein HY251_20235 [bacterium]|nr:hypothetical protein [bacterium]
MKTLDRMREVVRAGAHPFDLRFAKDAWDDGALTGDVAAVHRSTSLALAQLVEATTRDARTRAALVLGETGSGKTHVLARLRRATEGRAIFAGVTSPAPGAILGSIVEALAVDLKRPLRASGEAPPDARPRSQVAALVDPLVARFSACALGIDERIAAPYLTPDALDEEPPMAARLLERRFAPAIAARVPECSSRLVRALLLERAGIAGELDATLAALDPFTALRGLGALAARASVPLVIAVDQNDAVDVRALAGAVTRLHAAPGLVVAITFLRTLWDEKRDALIEPERQRIEENRLVLEPPSLAEVLAFVEARLEPLHGQLGDPEASRIFPLVSQDIERIAATSGRLLIRDWCRALAAILDERLGLSPIASAPEPVTATLQARLRELEAEIRARLPEGESPLREALALALRGAGVGEVSGPLDAEGAMDVIVATPVERIGLKVLDTERPPVLARKLEQLLDEIDAGQITRALLLRTREIPGSWHRCGALADELRGRGGDVVVLAEDERATLHALSRLDASVVAKLARETSVVPRLLDRPKTTVSA